MDRVASTDGTVFPRFKGRTVALSGFRHFRTRQHLRYAVFRLRSRSHRQEMAASPRRSAIQILYLLFRQGESESDHLEAFPRRRVRDSKSLPPVNSVRRFTPDVPPKKLSLPARAKPKRNSN